MHHTAGKPPFRLICGPNLARFHPQSESAKVGPKPAKFRPKSARCEHICGWGVDPFVTGSLPSGWSPVNPARGPSRTELHESVSPSVTAFLGAWSPGGPMSLMGGGMCAAAHVSDASPRTARRPGCRSLGRRRAHELFVRAVCSRSRSPLKIFGGRCNAAATVPRAIRHCARHVVHPLESTHRSWPGISKVGPCSAEFGRKPTQVGPGWAKAGQQWPGIHQTWSGIQQGCHEIGQSWPEIGRCRRGRAMSAIFRGNLANLGRRLAIFWASAPDVGRFRLA